MIRTCKVVDGKTVWEPPFTPEEDAAAAARLQEMFATGETPTLSTDNTFLEGHCNGSQWEGQERIGNMFRRKAERHGVNTKGKVYLSALALEPGDPKAWVSDRHDVQKVCEERNLKCEGAVKVAHREQEPAPAPRLAEPLVRRIMRQEIAKAPEKAKDLGELRHEVIEKHGRKK